MKSTILFVALFSSLAIAAPLPNWGGNGSGGSGESGSGGKGGSQTGSDGPVATTSSDAGKDSSCRPHSRQSLSIMG